MEQPSLSKELATRPAIAKRSKPTLMTLGEQQLSTDGKWHPDLAIEYICNNRGRQISVGELAKVFYHANIPRNKKRVRRCLPQLTRRLISREELLVRDTDPKTRRVLAVRLYDPRAEQDRQDVRDYLERLRSTRELNDSYYCRALTLVERKESQTPSSETSA